MQPITSAVIIHPIIDARRLLPPHKNKHNGLETQLHRCLMFASLFFFVFGQITPIGITFEHIMFFLRINCYFRSYCLSNHYTNGSFGGERKKNRSDYQLELVFQAEIWSIYLTIYHNGYFLSFFSSCVSVSVKNDSNR